MLLFAWMSLAEAATCEQLCTRVLTCMNAHTPLDQLACVVQCESAGGPDPRVASGVLGASTCEGALAALNGTPPPPPPPSRSTPTPTPPPPPPEDSFGSQRTGRPAAPPPGAPPGPPPANGACGSPRPAGHDAATYAALTRNAWCSYSYNGATEKKGRAVFGADGTLVVVEDSETVRTGSNTNQYGDTTQTYGAWGGGSDAVRGCWRLNGRSLELGGQGRWAPAPFTIVPNSAGWPILTVNGVEYMVCD